MIDEEILRSGVLYDPAPLLKEQQERLELLRSFNASAAPEREKMMCSLFASVGSSVYIETPFYANWAGQRVHIGNNVYINFLCCMVDDAPIWIGDRVMLGPRVTLCTASHPLSASLRSEGLQYNKEIHIADDVWISSHAFIGPGVSIGRGSVIGAGSVVLRDIPEGVLAYGVPARVILDITEDDKK